MKLTFLALTIFSCLLLSQTVTNTYTVPSPTLWTKQDSTATYDTSTDIVIGNPTAGSTLRAEGLTTSTHKDRYFNILSQVFDRSKPTAFPLSPSQAGVAGFFGAFGGANAVKSLEGINPLVQWDSRPTGTCDTSGTSVTYVSGSAFSATWVNATIEINEQSYKITAVNTNTNTITLETSAGSQTGVTFTVGGAIFGVEINVNNRWRDVSSSSGVAYDGLGIVSGHDYKPFRGFSVTSSQGATNAFKIGGQIAGWRDYGLLINGNYASSTGVGIDVTGGASGKALITRGESVATGASANLFRFTPSADSATSVVVYGTNAANSAIKWTINQDGQFVGKVRLQDFTPITGGSMMWQQSGTTLSLYAYNPDGSYLNNPITVTGTTNRVKFDATTGTPPFEIASTTPVPNLHGQVLNYNSSGAQQPNSFFVSGSVSLSGGTATITFTKVFANAGSYFCTATDSSAANVVSVQRVAGNQITLTGTGTDTIDYMCLGY